MSGFARAFAGKRVFLTGATGFLGKVLLAKLLREAPEIARVVILARRGSAATLDARIEADIVRSPALACIDGALLRARLRAVEGDATRPRFGLSEEAWRALAAEIDLVVHCAGLVDFSPALDQALAVNVEGARSAIALAAAAGAPLVHTSTCFVSGLKDGRISERLEVGDYPLQSERRYDGFDPEREIAACRAIVEQTRLEAEDPSIIAGLASEARDLAEARREAQARARRRLRELGKERARRWGFPNTYTYSKAIAEQLVAAARARGEVRAVVVRPAILESALEFPLAGWNQGANTSAPLIYLTYRGHRFWPTRPNAILDVLPIDQAAGAMVAIAAEALAGRAEAIYHLGTGDTNPMAFRRVIELTALRYRRRPVPGANPVLSLLKREIFEATGVSERFYRAFSLPLLAKAAKAAKQAVESLAPPAAPAEDAETRKGLARILRRARRTLGDAEKGLRRAEWLIEEYVPFIAGPRAIYETRNARARAPRLAPARGARGHGLRARGARLAPLLA